MSVKYLIDLKTFSDVRALDPMFWHEHGFEAIDDLDEPVFARNGMRAVIGSKDGCQNAAKEIGFGKHAARVYGQGTVNSLN